MDQPHLYSKYKEMQTLDNIHVVKTYLNLIRWDGGDTESVLDVGCGEGYTTLQVLLPQLPENCRKVVGSDISNKMVEFARKASAGNPRVKFRQMDIGKEIKWNVTEKFDHVFSFYCLHWVPAQRKAFENIFNLLKPGGDMLVSLLITAPIFQVYENISKNIRWAPYFIKESVSPYHHSKKADEEVKTILQDVGFESCKCIVEDKQYTFSNWNVLKHSIIAVNPTIPLLSSTDRIKYTEDFIEEVKNIYGYDLTVASNNNNGIPVNYKLLIVYARKPKNMKS
ncbi:juvenile hormone acid O-methyltransferase [Sitophilus oryzae]|uniref:Juvenile hormone acid O-methyltransferase n=1 Tax=Sitophilus oryzae TaxID=7048 RepID=A0A6J2X374_SITOR|nr:juvenile hormone acid O-methyltransferase [Sitophilus oryzae]XP_030745658.1 juvenile hormone acid O-methyltransferase [Sitophilus oryzae]XP_030745659.1 juvenile hormone acid O-methyltransferase [Sitophilus oryzae]